MQALILELHRTIISALFLSITIALVSCTTPKETASLVDDPNAKRESTVPWNKPERWESGGQLANMTDRR